MKGNQFTLTPDQTRPFTPLRSPSDNSDVSVDVLWKMGAAAEAAALAAVAAAAQQQEVSFYLQTKKKVHTHVCC